MSDAAALVAALRARLGHRHADVELVQTHISWVLLAGTSAYKIKKPVRFGFLDFSTLEARRRFCEEEVRLNRRLAPRLYVGVVSIRRGAGGPLIGSRGPLLEHAVKMRRFPADAVAGRRLARGALDAGHLALLAQRIARFHRDTPVAGADTDHGSVERIRADARRAVGALAALADADACARLAGWFDDRAVELAPRWQARRAGGRVREGHGDLHLDNVLVQGAEVTAFDCIEFDPGLRWIDVMNDVAYLVMDLLAHGRRDLAFGFLADYLEETGDHDGLDVLPFYLVYRAVVRSLVGALRQRGGAGDAAPAPADYLRLALALCERPAPRLLITHGLPGSGKTFATRQLLERVGAIRLRSDVERKRLAGLAPLADSRRAGNLYTAEATVATYAQLAELAAASLRAGWPTIVDAAFLRRAERDRMRALAASLRVPFAILDCQAPPALLRERLRQRRARGGDASEADERVLEQLASRAEPLGNDERQCVLDWRGDAPPPVDELAARWLAMPA